MSNSFEEWDYEEMQGEYARIEATFPATCLSTIDDAQAEAEKYKHWASIAIVSMPAMRSDFLDLAAMWEDVAETLEIGF